MKQIGGALGVCESRVSQLHSQAIASLRGQLAAHNEGVVLARRNRSRNQPRLRAQHVLRIKCPQMRPGDSARIMTPVAQK